MLEAYLKVLEVGYFEVQEAFKELPDAHVWKRPAEGLLSIGEVAGHVAYWEAVRLASDGGDAGSPGEMHGGDVDLARCRISSPLIDHRFSYYPKTLATPPSEQHQAMTAEEVCRELVRIHEEAVAYLRAQNPVPDGTPLGWAPPNTYADFLIYAAFHVSYHTGQIYSARHLMGETTPDN